MTSVPHVPAQGSAPRPAPATRLSGPVARPAVPIGTAFGSYLGAPLAPGAANRTAWPGRALSAEALVATPQGPRPAGDLAPGDLVLTRDGTPAVIRAARRHRLSLADLRAAPDLAPIRVEPAALPFAGLARALLLAPSQHLAFDADGGGIGDAAPHLVAARALCNGRTARRVLPEEGLTYVNLDCARPCLLLVEGIWLESGTLPRARRGLAAASAPTAAAEDIRVFTPL